MEDKGLGHPRSAAPTSTSDLSQVSQTGVGLPAAVSAAQLDVLGDNADWAPLPGSSVHSCAQRYGQPTYESIRCHWTPLNQARALQEVTLCRKAQQGDVIEDTDTSPDSDSLLDSDQLTVADPAGKKFAMEEQQGCYECSFAGERSPTGRLQAPVFVWHSSIWLPVSKVN